MVAATHTVAPGTVLAEKRRWEGLGIATFPGPRGRKGPRETGWPPIPHTDAWDLTEEAAGRDEVNLVIRTGISADRKRFSAAIDLDGKCSCDHDRNEHRDEGACVRAGGGETCPCPTYDGTPPEAALEHLLAVLPT